MTTTLLMAVTLVTGGQPAANIVLEPAAAKNAQLAYAAKELTNWIGKITGAKLETVEADAQGGGKAKVVLGTPETSKLIAAFAKERAADFARLKDNDGFIIAENGNAVYLAAGRTKGVLNAVYRFLERNSDIIWVRPMEAEDGFGTIYGKKTGFANVVKNLVDVPSFGHHRYWSGGRNSDPHQARLLNTWDKAVYGDTTLHQVLFPNTLLSKHLKEHPEVSALLPNGKRAGGHDFNLCYMHPKTFELFAREAEAVVAKNPDVTEWFVGIADSWAVCECELCKKPIALPNGKVVSHGDDNFRSTQYNLFLDRLTKHLKTKFPNFTTIRSDAYLFNAIPPAYKTGRPVGPYCPYVKNHKRPVFDDQVNGHWHALAEGYRKAGMPFGSLYEYYLCTTTPYFPHAVCEVAQQDFKYYLPEMTGIYLDARGHDLAKGESAFELSAIEFWTMSRLMWKVDIDIKETRREFCRRAYREAAPQMIAYHEKLAEIYNADSTGCFWNDDPVIACKHYIVEGGLADWVRAILAKAEAAAKHPGSKELVRRHRAKMLELIDKAEKAPKRVVHTVKQLKGVPDLDPNGGYWKDVEAIGPITKIAKPDSVDHTTIKVAHDRANLFVLFEFRDAPHFLAKWKAFADKGQVDNWPKDEPFQWDTPVEMYLDGDLGLKGSYYMFSNMFNGHKTTCRGSSSGDPVDWKVKMEPTDTGLRLLATFPFESIGVDISKGNKIGAMFLGATKPGFAWNGGQWHSPGGFQTLLLEMK